MDLLKGNPSKSSQDSSIGSPDPANLEADNETIKNTQNLLFKVLNLC